ncbi:TetR/AcrR family transcriptional regulator [Kutzneria albida]|uniref:HTH tetR-type domain-containing protein n=1 Tax=Kutzneria albida DSM 43870 TaxID=1449976 RepID=W5WFB8_9PSEU|nr:TetR/AcrR family transcriptional regulator [Kutzneria albida]AHH99450.1 hypothetical protein KALB_6090 [Kutzneria albida DSM 43870]
MSPTPSTERPVRGRRAPRVSGDDRERAILATAERLLEQRPYHEISTDDLARGAGISRPTFYFYFASKDAVLLALFDRIIEQAEAGRIEVLGRDRDDPAARWREAIGVFYETFGAHRAVTLAAAEVQLSNSEVRELWSKVMEGWASDTAALIEAERERGAAPPGAPARDLAIALIRMNERMLHATFAGESPSVSEQDVVEVLATIWLSTIYGPAR